MWAFVSDLPFADEDDRCKRRDTCNVMNNNPAGKIEHSPLLQNAIPPDHVDEGEVDKDQPSGQEEHIRLKRDAIGERPGNEGRGDDREHHLICDEHDKRDAAIDW